jgi:hypothetical protein
VALEDGDGVDDGVADGLGVLVGVGDGELDGADTGRPANTSVIIVASAPAASPKAGEPLS